MVNTVFLEALVKPHGKKTRKTCYIYCIFFLGSTLCMGLLEVILECLQKQIPFHYLEPTDLLSRKPTFDSWMYLKHLETTHHSSVQKQQRHPHTIMVVGPSFIFISMACYGQGTGHVSEPKVLVEGHGLIQRTQRNPQLVPLCLLVTFLLNKT